MTTNSTVVTGDIAMDVVVVKIGGEVVQGPFMKALAEDIAQMDKGGRAVVVVHGAGPQTSDLQKRLGQAPKMVAGQRVTDEATLDAVKMAVAGKVNVDVCCALNAVGCEPVGLHGASALVVRAKRRPPKVMAGAGTDPIDLGLVGDVVSINTALLSLLARTGRVPVLACLAADAEGSAFNINADTVANKVAIALNAAALVLVTDVPAVLKNVNDPASRIAKMTASEGRRAIEEGTVTKGMIPKLEESFAAIKEGVRAVHIVGRLQRGDLAKEVAKPGSVGTVLVP